MANNRRIDRSKAMELLEEMPMGELMALAHQERTKRFTDGIVTFVVDTNPNYTNICVTRCAFCAFCRKPSERGAFLLSPEEIAQKVSEAEKKGATTVLLQGGHNPNVHLEDWKRYIAAIHSACPTVHLHPFSPAEIVFMAEQEKCSTRDILNTLWENGIRTLPGGGAEILTERVRRSIAPNKASTDQWLDVCEKAHRIGFKTTATMMFGHVEDNEDILDHLFQLRDLQDRTGGFTSFIPWSFKPGGSQLGNRLSRVVHPAKYVRIIAVARIVLDNFKHIQSSWFSENIPAGQLGLLAGADDFGGVLVEEHVHKEAGHERRANIDDVLTIIRRCGFTPARRDSNYRIQETYEPPRYAGLSTEDA
jgi:cyclic dehypoxanthinyl futalosine synthase